MNYNSRTDLTEDRVFNTFKNIINKDKTIGKKRIKSKIINELQCSWTAIRNRFGDFNQILPKIGLTIPSVVGKCNLGHKHTPKTRLKMAVSRHGTRHPMYGKSRNDLALFNTLNKKGRTYEEIYGEQRANKIRQKLSLAGIGKKRSETTKQKMKKPKSIEHCYNIGLGNKGKLLGKSYEKKVGIEYAKVYRQKVARKLDKNGAWKGGISFEPYGLDFNRYFKRKILDRDNHRCLICSKTKGEVYRLDVHHIDYIKTNNTFENCVTLCINHHALTQFNREQWTIKLQKLLAENYGYEYQSVETQKRLCAIDCSVGSR